MSRWTAAAGTPFPLDVTWVEQDHAYNFALYSKHAESVTLLLYGEYDLSTPLLSHRLDHLKNKSGRVWHCRVARSVSLLYVMINAYWEPLTSTIQNGPAEKWTRVVDTSKESPDDFLEPGNGRPIASLTCLVQPRSVVVLLER